MYQGMINLNTGKWFGAFIEGKLVGSVGFFYDSEIGRIQNILTHQDFRRLNICKTLVTHACKFGLSKVTSLIMIADTDYHAARIYVNIGFSCVEEICSLY
jgi:hypothetical protein